MRGPELAAFLMPLAFAATGLDGAAVKVFGRDHKPVVLFFLRTDCPISNAYAPEIQRIATEYSPRVNIFLVYPDPAEDADAIHKHLAQYGYHIGAIRDSDHALAKKSLARVTPEAAVFSAGGELKYHGRIDDRYVDFGKVRREPAARDLRDALDAVLAGRPVRRSQTRAIGCSLADMRG